MRLRLLGAMILPIALGTFGVLAATGFGDGGGTSPARPTTAGYHDPGSSLHRVSAPSAGATAAATATASARRPKVIYLETNEPETIDSTQPVGGELPCPKRSKVLGGYFVSDGSDVALTRSSVESTRSWFVGVTKIDGVGGFPATEVLLGIVCAKGVRA